MLSAVSPPPPQPSSQQPMTCVSEMRRLPTRFHNKQVSQGPSETQLSPRKPSLKVQQTIQALHEQHSPTKSTGKCDFSEFWSDAVEIKRNESTRTPSANFGRALQMWKQRESVTGTSTQIISVSNSISLY